MKASITFVSAFAAFILLTLFVTGYFGDQITLSHLAVKKQTLEIEKLELELAVYREQATANISVD